ncbi:uncharacterized protein SCHCODRAFT_01092035 [Schizophyllum commune H4-8]|uniref:uncharacterized protein n=1 Tax=Schizophyllum commune (strain H4-8 / FGSC 9210) TaxID=578458 RepID=UPI00215F9D19|nr:uncharacterized protein SCHCODRAFT_01092035 [Schizophyllum commune H4-8]KAI5895907.1 hypothetical protein SCHCODRAFT_01092035 [Schizophyllum commune H4-8]
MKLSHGSSTCLAQEHADIFEEGEWVWADSAYPISEWAVAPYKAPERDDPENAAFNNQVSILRIRSEHAISYLKGRFQSLKNLRVDIRDARTHKLATYWIVSCIGIQSSPS